MQTPFTSIKYIYVIVLKINSTIILKKAFFINKFLHWVYNLNSLGCKTIKAFAIFLTTHCKNLFIEFVYYNHIIASIETCFITHKVLNFFFFTFILCSCWQIKYCYYVHAFLNSKFFIVIIFQARRPWLGTLNSNPKRFYHIFGPNT